MTGWQCRDFYLLKGMHFYRKKIFRVFKDQKYFKELYKVIFRNPSPKIFWLKCSKWLKCYVMQPLTSDQQLWKGSYASMLLILCMPSNPPMTYTLPPNTAILCLQRPILRYSICIHLLMEALYFQTSCFVSLPPVVYMTCKYDSTACIYLKTPICLNLSVFSHNVHHYYWLLTGPVTTEENFCI